MPGRTALKSGRIDDALIDAIVEAVKNTRTTRSEIFTERLYLGLFFSYDLVNSTALKLERRAQNKPWVQIFRRFYEACEDAAAPTGARLWKYIGDEAAFYVKIRSKERLTEMVEKISDGVENITAALYQFDNTIASKVAVKGCAWMAPVKSIGPRLSPRSASRHSRLIQLRRNDDQEVAIIRDSVERSTDFLGRNIDLGFRLAHYSKKNQLALAPALAHFIADDPGFKARLRIVDAVRLKGVAGGSQIPVVWYRRSWRNVDGDFTYKERFEDQTVRQACHHSEPIGCLADSYDELSQEGYIFGRELLAKTLALRG